MANMTATLPIMVPKQITESTRIFVASTSGSSSRKLSWGDELLMSKILLCQIRQTIDVE